MSVLAALPDVFAELAPPSQAVLRGSRFRALGQGLGLSAWLVFLALGHCPAVGFK